MTSGPDEWWKTLSLRDVLQTLKNKKPKIAQGMEGAAAQEIDAFQSLVGRPLPEDYRVFLEFMGRRSDAFFAGRTGRYDFTLAWVTEQLTPSRRGKSPKRGTPKVDTDRYLLIGGQFHSQDGGAYYLDTSSAEPVVVNIDANSEVWRTFGPLKNFLMTCGLHPETEF